MRKLDGKVYRYLDLKGTLPKVSFWSFFSPLPFIFTQLDFLLLTSGC